MKLNLLCLLLAVALTSPALTTEETSKDYKRLRVRIGNSTTKAVLSGTLTIPCHILYHSPADEVTVGRRAVLATPRVKWTFISNGKEQEILVARGHKVKISEGYKLRASLPHYTTSAYDVTLVLKELISNDSGIYKCHVQHGIEDDYDMLQVKVKGVVFLYREGISRYAYTFPMAQEACAKIQAHIATAEQLLAAYHGGYEQCDAGWIADQTVRYPIQTPREGCYGDMDGFPGVRNYGVLDPDDMYDVYCYVDELNGEVFLGSTPTKFTLSEARDYCINMGAVLATTGQIYAAWNEELDHCNPGWLSDGSVRFPIITPREKCGGNSLGVKTVFQFRNQTGFPNPLSKYDVYCFKGNGLVPTQDPDKGSSPSPPTERVHDVIKVTESFEELKLPEVKAENEAQGSLDTIPLNKPEATSPSKEDMENMPTFKDHQGLTPQPTAPIGEHGENEEDLSPEFASFPPYEDNSDDSGESTTTDSVTMAILGQSQGDTPGFVTEPASGTFEGQVLQTTDNCYPNPCENGGTCIEEDDDDFSCLCLPGYFGRVCEINVEKCPDQWDSFQGFCYMHFYTRKSWQEAETDCRDYGGHLVSIVTPEEQEFVKNQYKDYQWTGLNDRTIEGDFQWSDGNAVLFENWKSGQPDSYFLSGEDCVVMGGHEEGLWSDVPCNYHLPYTCKMGLVTCGPPPEVTNASAYGRPKTRYQIGSVVGYRCQDGFIQRSSPIIRCQSDGGWESPKVYCLPSPQ